MEEAGDERAELGLALPLGLAMPLWLIGAAVLLFGIVRGRPLFALAGAAAIAYDRRAGSLERTLGTIGALTRRTHDDTPD